MSLVEGAKISKGNVSTQAEATGLSATGATVTATNQTNTPGLVVGDATGVNKTNSFLTRQERVTMDDSDDNLSGLKGLNLYETDEEDLLMVSSEPLKANEDVHPEAHDPAKGDTEQKNRKQDSEQDERKRLAGYKRSLRYVRTLDSRDPASLTTREKRLRRKHTYHIQKYEAMLNTTVVEVRPAKTKTEPNQSRQVITSKHVPHASTGPNTIIVSEDLDVRPSTSKRATSGPKRGDDQCGTTKSASTTPKVLSAISSTRGTAMASKGTASRPSIKRQRSGETQVSEGKRLKPSTSLTSAPELQVAIIDRSQPDGKMTTDRWLLLEEKILRALVDELACSEDDSFTAFDGAKWLKGVKIIGCGNEKALGFLSNCIRGVGELWPNARIEIVPLDQVPFRTTVRVWVPPPLLEDEATLTLIKRQNKELGTEDWTIERGRSRDKGEGKDLWIKIGSESLRLLRSSQGVIKYGLNQLRLILPAVKRNDEPKRPESGTD
ncbi:uncharacterized protein LOC135958585 [Calliphora vicina]|uniref:uncharacterized protein LOC135949044 n=1 Tax=Calliphora vicina TaxID=7373 RepID=UPI00325BECF3